MCVCCSFASIKKKSWFVRHKQLLTGQHLQTSTNLSPCARTRHKFVGACRQCVFIYTFLNCALNFVVVVVVCPLWIGLNWRQISVFFLSLSSVDAHSLSVRASHLANQINLSLSLAGRNLMIVCAPCEVFLVVVVYCIEKRVGCCQFRGNIRLASHPLT